MEGRRRQGRGRTARQAMRKTPRKQIQHGLLHQKAVPPEWEALNLTSRTRAVTALPMRSISTRGRKNNAPLTKKYYPMSPSPSGSQSQSENEIGSSYYSNGVGYTSVEYFELPSESGYLAPLSITSSKKPFYTWNHETVLPTDHVNNSLASTETLSSSSEQSQSGNSPKCVPPRARPTQKPRHLQPLQTAHHHHCIARPCSVLETSTTPLGDPSHWPGWGRESSEDPSPHWRPLYNPFGRGDAKKRFESTGTLVTRALEISVGSRSKLCSPLRSDGHVPVFSESPARKARQDASVAWSFAGKELPQPSSPFHRHQVGGVSRSPVIGRDFAGPTGFYTTSRLSRYIIQ